MCIHGVTFIIFFLNWDSLPEVNQAPCPTVADSISLGMTYWTLSILPNYWACTFLSKVLQLRWWLLFPYVESRIFPVPTFGCCTESIWIIEQRLYSIRPGRKLHPSEFTWICWSQNWPPYLPLNYICRAWINSRKCNRHERTFNTQNFNNSSKLLSRCIISRYKYRKITPPDSLAFA